MMTLLNNHIKRLKKQFLNDFSSFGSSCITITADHRYHHHQPNHRTNLSLLHQKSSPCTFQNIFYVLQNFDLHRYIPDNCHFFYTDKIFGAKNLHPKVRKSGQIGFRNKIV